MTFQLALVALGASIAVGMAVNLTWLAWRPGARRASGRMLEPGGELAVQLALAHLRRSREHLAAGDMDGATRALCSVEDELTDMARAA